MFNGVFYITSIAAHMCCVLNVRESSQQTRGSDRRTVQRGSDASDEGCNRATAIACCPLDSSRVFNRGYDLVASLCFFLLHLNGFIDDHQAYHGLGENTFIKRAWRGGIVAIRLLEEFSVELVACLP